MPRPVTSGGAGPRLAATLARDMARALDPFCSRELTLWRVVVQLLQPEARLVASYRLYSWMHMRNWLWPAHLLHMFVRGRTSCEIAPNARIGPGLRVEHRSDVVIGANAVLGGDVSIYNGVTVGKRRPPWEHEMPTIGDRVILGSGAKVLGSLVIGDDAIVAANAVVLGDVEAGSVVGGIPARLVGAAPIQAMGPAGTSAARCDGPGIEALIRSPAEFCAKLGLGRSAATRARRKRR